ncbi:MAG: COX15/CtaA family protein [Gemmatimonadetes bacterium]|nr:COX15/CtaA family protein [Gemmatimonadota bacterium]
MDPTYISTAAHDRAVRRWLYATMLAVVAVLVVGGITRLTESGLSITVWKPITGVLPPMSEAGWLHAFEQYQQIPEAQTVHAGITLAKFKNLFFWEWAHRLIARLVGLVIAIPFFYLLLKRRIRPALRIRLANLPILVALQGVMGWYMVQSGLSERTSVSAYRLTAHLALAIIIYVVAAWTAFRLHPSSESDAVAIDHTAPNGGAVALSALVFVVILTGGFVAGLDAGLVYNTFPLMGGSVVPPTYGDLAPMWRNWFENPAAVQFHHRTLALITLAIALWYAWRRRAVASDAAARRTWLYVQLAGMLQVTLGVATLLLHVPISLAALHQAGAVVLLTATLYAGARDGAVPETSPRLRST